MKKYVVAATLAAGLSASALTGCRPVTFPNCTEMNKVHKGGVGRPGAVDIRANGGRALYPPIWDAALYQANIKSDRDRDGIACER